MWYGVELRAPDRAPRVVTIRAPDPEAAAEVAEDRHPRYAAAAT